MHGMDKDALLCFGLSCFTYSLNNFALNKHCTYDLFKIFCTVSLLSNNVQKSIEDQTHAHYNTSTLYIYTRE